MRSLHLECRTLLIECKALLIEYRALLIECRALLINNIYICTYTYTRLEAEPDEQGAAQGTYC